MLDSIVREGIIKQIFYDLPLKTNEHITELSSPTVCVTGAGAGVDSAWEQRKLEARKMLENAEESPASSARFVRWRVLEFFIC